MAQTQDAGAGRLTLLRAHPVAFLTTAGVATLCVAGVVLLLANTGNRVPASGADLDQTLADPVFTVTKLVATALFAVAGWLLASRRPDSPLGSVVLVAAVADGIAVVAGQWAVLGVVGGHPLPLLGPALWLSSWPYAVEPAVVLILYWYFPDGRRATGILGAAAGAAVALSVVGLLGSVLAPLGVDPHGPFAGATSPLGSLTVAGVDGLIGLGLIVGNLVLVIRWARTEPTERAAYRALSVIALTGFLLPLLPVSTSWARVLYEAHTILLLLVVLASVLRHRLYGIDLVLNRTLVYVTLSALITACYAAIVGGVALIGWTTGSTGELPAAVIAALLLVLARDHVQRAVNRFLYGRTDEPFTVVSRIATRVEESADPERALADLLQALVEDLRVPYARLRLVSPDGIEDEISVGESAAADGHGFPLVMHGEQSGELVVGRRPGQPGLRPLEAELLRHVAGQAAVAAQAVTLNRQLVRSRARVVAAAEDERRRLRRDLHDGLGPILTAAASRVDACMGYLERDPRVSAELLVDVRHDLSTGMADLRRVLNSLRPIALDELGLLEAVRQQCRRCVVPTVATLPAEAPSLSAAVEITAYRIVTEALTNVTRHANAQHCTVEVRFDEAMTIEVRDDGAASGAWQPGIGLVAMRERTGDLGGWWYAGPDPQGGGGLVKAVLPLAPALEPALREEPS